MDGQCQGEGHGLSNEFARLIHAGKEAIDWKFISGYTVIVKNNIVYNYLSLV